jgi:hypothetical protein
MHDKMRIDALGKFFVTTEQSEIFASKTRVNYHEVYGLARSAL